MTKTLTLEELEALIAGEVLNSPEPTPEIKLAVEQKIEECFVVLEAAFATTLAVSDITTTLIRPEIVYDLKGHTAGQARVSHSKDIRQIRLNLDILNNPKHYEDMLKRTIPHEVAHIVQFSLWRGSQPHGREWARVMRALGLPPERCHNYETKAARKVSRPHTYYCECGEHQISDTIRNRMIFHGRQYLCKRCNTVLSKTPLYT